MLKLSKDNIKKLNPSKKELRVIQEKEVLKIIKIFQKVN